MIGPKGTDPEKWELRASTVLSVDMEEGGPAWHLMGIVRHGDDSLKLARWPDEMHDYFGGEVRACIPKWPDRYADGDFRADKDRHVLHVRSKLDEQEMFWLQATDMLHQATAEEVNAIVGGITIH